MSGLMALSIRQPWAWAIITQGKTVENRTWRTTAEPPVDIAIHAGRAFDEDAQMPVPAAAGALRSAIAQIRLAGGVRAELRAMLTGRVLAVASLAGIHWWEDCRSGDSLCSPWAFPGQWHWELANVHPLARPVPCKGALGLWRPPADVENAIMEQLAAPVGQGGAR